MAEVGLLQLGHLLCLVYWLGADVGVFYASYFVADDRLSPETRVTMATLLFALDQAPRICMPLILGFGVHLAWRLGALPLTAGWVVAIWLVCLAWLAMVITLHKLGSAATRLTRFDLCFRVAIVVGLGGYSMFSLATNRLADWIALKLLVFAALVLFGLIVRLRLKPFGPAFAALVSGNPSDADNAAIRDSLARTRPFVIAIWAGLLINTALGLHLI